MTSRPRYWWTTVKGGRRSMRRRWKYRHEPTCRNDRLQALELAFMRQEHIDYYGRHDPDKDEA